MALLSGQALASMAELNTMATHVCAAEDSDDDEYVYVSSLAEQIAHALMLDDEEEPPARDLSNRPSAARSLQHELPTRRDIAWPVMSPREDIYGVELMNTELMFPVSRLASAWQGHGPVEWDCAHMPVTQKAPWQLSHLRISSQLDGSFSKQRHVLTGNDSSLLVSNKHVAASSLHERWTQHRTEISPTVYDAMPPPIRKESVGTGVFLPNIVNSSLHYRRKSGFSSSKSAYGSRHRCQ